MKVRMELSRILIRELNDVQIIELREMREDESLPDGDPAARTFPIVIGLPEAQAIERRLKGITIKRPQTHDLLANVIEALGAKLTSITVTKLEEHTYFASLDIRQIDGTTTAIDCRPSDAIAIGIGVGVPIYVDESVLQAALKDDNEDLP
jgi:bifunctional DNase/RNase